MKMTSLKMGETPRLRTDLVDKVLLDAVAAGLKSNKKVIRTTKGPKTKRTNQQQKVGQRIITISLNFCSFLDIFLTFCS